MRGRWASSNSYPYRVLQSFGFIRGAQESIYGRRSIEMRDVLFLEDFPDERVVNFPQAVMSASNRSHGPWERPTLGELNKRLWKFRSGMTYLWRETWAKSKDSDNDRHDN